MSDTRGRVDVLFTQLVEYILTEVERERGIKGLNEKLMPLINSAVLPKLPKCNLFDLTVDDIQHMSKKRQK